MAKPNDYLKAMQQAVAGLGEGKRLVDFEMHHSYYAYLVIEHTSPQQQPVRTAAFCIFGTVRDEQGHATVCVNTLLGEERNPRPTEPSGRLLELLSPPETEAAAAWRQRCQDTLVQKRQRFGPQPGDVIVTRPHLPGEAQQAFYILQPRGYTSAYGLGLLDGRKYGLRFDGQSLSAVLYGKNGQERCGEARFEYGYQAGMAADAAEVQSHDLVPWELCQHSIKRRYRPRQVLAFALRRPCQRFGLNWPLSVQAIGTPVAIATQVEEHNKTVPEEQSADIGTQDCWI